ncbi:MAG: MSMEG_4193 family putative phosphomutase [Anaerolineae bacterium]|nr:MSMEG_4193 family putative phosphomutase [Anaerolineae bacterium]
MSEDTEKEPKQEKKPTTVLFIRHGENEWTKSNKLAGRTPGVYLNEQGRKQAEALGERLAKEKIDALYTSPLERTVETARIIAAHHNLEVKQHSGLLEVDYGEWTGEEIKKLSQEKSWSQIQFYPSGAGFPGGETMYEMQARFVKEVNALVAQHPEQKIAIVGHADLIKAAIAHYLGVHFDLFQRIVISTASLTTVNFTFMGPRVVCVNDTNHNPPPPQEEKE